MSPELRAIILGLVCSGVLYLFIGLLSYSIADIQIALKQRKRAKQH